MNKIFGLIGFISDEMILMMNEINKLNFKLIDIISWNDMLLMNIMD